MNGKRYATQILIITKRELCDYINIRQNRFQVKNYLKSLLTHCTPESKMGHQQLTGATHKNLARVLALAKSAQ